MEPFIWSFHAWVVPCTYTTTTLSFPSARCYLHLCYLFVWANDHVVLRYQWADCIYCRIGVKWHSMPLPVPTMMTMKGLTLIFRLPMEQYCLDIQGQSSWNNANAWFQSISTVNPEPPEPQSIWIAYLNVLIRSFKWVIQTARLNEPLNQFKSI